LAVSGLTAIVFALVVPQFRLLLDEVYSAVPPPTQFLLWIYDTVGPAILPCLAAIAVLLLVVRMFGGPARWRRLMWGIPIFGRLFSWSGTSELARLLKILLRQDIPLPEALRLSSEGVHDANVSLAALALAADVESGSTLHDALIHTARLPASMIPVVRWGETTDNLPDALQAASEMFDGRVRLRALWLTTVLPPLTFILVGVLILIVVGCLFLPLLSLIRMLTSFAPVTGGQQAAYEAVGTGLFSLVILGASLLLAVKIAYVRRRATGDDAMVLALTIAGWGLLLLGFLGTMCFLAFPLGFFFSLVTMVVFAMAVAKFRGSERRSLLWVLAVSAERGLPLAPAARAFAAERADEQGRRAMRLADLLEAGVPLPEAFDRSGNRLPTDACLAVRVGSQTHDMGSWMKQVAQDRNQINPVWQTLYEKSLYLVILLVVAGVNFAFLGFKVMPTYEKIFQDFDTPLPAMTMAAIGVSSWFAGFGVLVLPLVLLLIGVCGIGVFYYMGWMWWEPPLLHWFTRRIHSANIMRSLSHTLTQDMPLPESLDLLRRCYPKAHIRSRLDRACVRVQQGSQWCDALRRSGLITKADAAVLRAAQRVGNLPWALREMASSSVRRLTYRITALHRVAYPMIVIALALPIAWCAVAFVLPLAQLVENLSHG
jgi:type II secretory pathway component PulF